MPKINIKKNLLTSAGTLTPFTTEFVVGVVKLADGGGANFVFITQT